jgi:hypothetical protein
MELSYEQRISTDMVNISTPEIFFIIQGPVEERTSDVSYDPKASLLNLVCKTMNTGVQVVVSSWDGHLNREDIQVIEGLGATVILSKKFIPPGGGDIDTRIRKLANKALMYYTTKVGLEYVNKNSKNSENCFVVKVRSDVDLDVQKIVDCIRSNNSILKGRFLIQYFEPLAFGLKSMRIPDFWFGAYFNDINKLVTILSDKACAGNSFSLLSHYDFSLSLLSSLGFKHVKYVLGLEQFRFTHPESKSKAFLHYLLRFINSIIFNFRVVDRFVLGTRDIEMSIVWRGRIFYKDEMFSFKKRFFT